MSTSTSPPPERASLSDHPLGFWFFFWGEFAERCCFYGMRAILLLYMIQILDFNDPRANAITSYYIAGCYLLPLIGGYIADNYLGKYWTIVYFSIPYIIGQTILGISALHNETCLYLSLGLLAMGSGVIKPNISTLMGLTYDQKRPGRKKLRSDAFAMFYGAINIGSSLSSIAVPAIRNYFGGSSQAYAIAFLFPAALMILAFIVFAAGKPFYAQEKIQRTTVSPEERRQRWIVVRRLFGIFALVTIFWSIFDQTVNIWILFARDYLHLQFFWWSLSPDQLPACNPILVVLLLPIVTFAWHFLANMGINLHPTSKMLIGFILTFITMLIITWSGFLGSNTVTKGGPAAIKAAERAAAFALEKQSASARAASAVLISAELTEEIAQLSLTEEVQSAITDDPKKHSEEMAAMLTAGRKYRNSAKGLFQETSPKPPAAKLLQSTLEGMQRSSDALTQVQPLAKIINAESKAAKKAAEALLKNRKLAADAALATAVQASVDAAKCARAAMTASQDKKITASETEEILSTAVLVEAAAEAVKKADRAAQKGDKIPVEILFACSDARNRATAAVDSAKKVIEELKRENPNQELAFEYASIAALVSADTAALVAETTAKAQGKDVPKIVEETRTIAAKGRISIWWQIIPYILLTTAELCISVVGLELAYAAAPMTMKSFVTACWLVTVFLANFINAQVTPWYSQYVGWFDVTLTPGIYFSLFALVMIPVILIFMLVSRRFNKVRPPGS